MEHAIAIPFADHGPDASYPWLVVWISRVPGPWVKIESISLLPGKQDKTRLVGLLKDGNALVIFSDSLYGKNGKFPVARGALAFGNLF